MKTIIKTVICCISLFLITVMLYGCGNYDSNIDYENQEEEYVESTSSGVTLADDAIDSLVVYENILPCIKCDFTVVKKNLESIMGISQDESADGWNQEDLQDVGVPGYMYQINSEDNGVNIVVSTTYDQANIIAVQFGTENDLLQDKKLYKKAIKFLYKTIAKNVKYKKFEKNIKKLKSVNDRLVANGVEMGLDDISSLDGTKTYNTLSIQSSSVEGIEKHKQSGNYNFIDGAVDMRK